MFKLCLVQGHFPQHKQMLQEITLYDKDSGHTDIITTYDSLLKVYGVNLGG